MQSSPRAFGVTVAAALATALFPRTAAAAPVDPDAAHDAHELDRVRHLTVTVNPLAVLVNRWGGNVEVLPARHHAIEVSGYLQSFSLARVRSFMPEEVRSYVKDDAPSVAGGELGYRFYTGRTGADGFFIGPSGVVVPLAYPRLSPSSSSVELQPYRALGGALDVGVQAATRAGFTVGGGIGVMLVTSKLPPDPNRIAVPVAMNLLPRILVTAGWSF